MTTITNLWHSYSAYLIPFIAAYILNVLYGHRSQVDAWCNANPKRAAIMKIIRGLLPIDPWLIIQGISLIFKGKLPTKWQNVVSILPAVPEAPPAISEAVVPAEASPVVEKPPTVPPAA